ncbi:unnamed protein product, partial [Brassica oleracea var. botrytis]
MQGCVYCGEKDRLSTGIRMREWGMEQGCVYCGEKDETRNHLFFACPYTFTVWKNVAEKLLDTILLRLVFQTAVYVLWKERNSKRHGGVCASVD